MFLIETDGPCSQSSCHRCTLIHKSSTQTTQINDSHLIVKNEERRGTWTNGRLYTLFSYNIRRNLQVIQPKEQSCAFWDPFGSRLCRRMLVRKELRNGDIVSSISNVGIFLSLSPPVPASVSLTHISL